LRLGPGRGPARRTGLGAALALGALVVALCATAGGAAAAEGCEWQPHTVRVVKHVKRHGRRVKVVRQRVRWSCDALPAPVAIPSAPVVAPPVAPAPIVTPPQPPAEESGDAHYVGARAYERGLEYGFEPTGPGFEVEAGHDTIELINGGEDDHDLHLEKAGTGDLLALKTTHPGETDKATADLEPGTYIIYCSLPTHRSKHGMERTLVVAP
jgi:plastocyanin